MLIGKQQLLEVSEHKLLGITIDNNLTWDPQIRDLCKSNAKRAYQSAKMKNFLTFMLEKLFPSPYTISYRVCFNSLAFCK